MGNQEGMERFLKSALQADISLDWGEHVGGELAINSSNEEVDERSLAETSYSVRCSAIGGDTTAPSPCIKVEQGKAYTEAHVVEDSLKDFFQPEDLDDGRSVFSMYLKEMADIFNHMGYSDYFHTLTKANEYHRCRWPFHVVEDSLRGFFQPHPEALQGFEARSEAVLQGSRSMRLGLAHGTSRVRNRAGPPTDRCSSSSSSS